VVTLVELSVELVELSTLVELSMEVELSVELSVPFVLLLTLPDPSVELVSLETLTMGWLGKTGRGKVKLH